MRADRILLCDDDERAAGLLSQTLRDSGFEVLWAASARECLELARQHQFALAIVDVMVPPDGIDFVEAKGGFEAGTALARRLRGIESAADLQIVGLSQAPNEDIRRWFAAHGSGFWEKSPLIQHPEALVRRISVLLHSTGLSGVRALLVHGHDRAATLELREYLRNTLHLADPAILWEVPWSGRTTFEKFEDAARDADVVFVLMTPDDVASSSSEIVHEGRPNVLLELGYFLGAMTRRRGHVVILTKGGVKLPGDLLGMGVVDVTDGIAAADRAIRRELAALI